MSLTGWLGLERGLDPLSDLFDLVARFASTAGRDLPHATDAQRAHATAPQCHGAPLDAELRGVRLGGLARDRPQNDPRAQHDLLWCRTGPDPLFKAEYLRIRQNYR